MKPNRINPASSTKHLLCAACAVALLVVVGPADAASGEASLSGDTLTWQSSRAEDGATLRISGPDIVFDREFEAGSTISQSAFDPEGYALPDGLYTWEIRSNAPRMTAERQARLRAQGADTDTQTEPISGSFTILNGAIVDPNLAEEFVATEEVGVRSADEPLVTNATLADQVILDDLIVDGSACIGQDCANGESFGFDTIRIKENNLRIKAQDTSTSASFPTNDWQLTFNESDNGGANKFSIDDIDGGRTPFTIEAGARNNALVVEADGDIGVGTINPVVDFHIVTGNTPTLRLEQDGSSGFTSQTWDVAGNEANFFIRDATNGSKLPIQIKPGAPTASLFIAAGGDTGMGTAAPSAPLHVRRTDGSGRVFVEDTQSQAATDLLELSANGNPRMIWRDTSEDLFWRLSSETSATEFVITRSGTGEREFVVDENGNVEARGTITANVASPFTLPDYVFEPDYELMPLQELESYIQEHKRLPRVPSAQEVYDEGLNMTDMQIRLLEKVEELTLYTLEQQKLISALEARLESLEGGEQR